MIKPPTRVAIAASSAATVDAGVRIARQGGNAIDIAVAAALTATASEILMCSLGGSGFLMLHIPGEATELIEGADAMPGKGHRRPTGTPTWREVHVPYGDGINVMSGHAAIAVPGILAALELAWTRHGSLPWAEIMAPALDTTKNGWAVAPATAAWLDLTGEPVFGQQPASRASFFPDGEMVRVHQTMRIPDLHATMETIAREGARALYEGELAAAFTREVEEHGGYVTRADMSAYRAQVREPLQLTSRGFKLALNPPPAVGGAAVGTLIGLMDLDWTAERDDAKRALDWARAQKFVLDLRDRELTHPAFDDPRARALLAPDTLHRHAQALRSPHTTQMSIATGDGSLVSITMSMGYGAGVTIPGTGIACNNSLGEPELNPQGYFARPPGSRLVSNMAPTVAWHEDGRRIAYGSPGASRITTAIAQTWARYAFEGDSLEQAITRPRLHVENWHDGFRVQCEPGFNTKRLETEFIIRPFDQRHMFFGGTHAAGLDRAGNLHAVADARRSGKTAIQ